MRTRLLIALVGAVVSAAVAVAASSPPQGFAVPAGLGARAKEEAPLLGMAWGKTERRLEIVHVDPVTLEPRPEPALRVGTYGTYWSYSPDRARLAVGTTVETKRGTATSLQIADPTTLRRELALPLGFGAIRGLAWLEPDRVSVVWVGYHPERLEVLTVAPSARRVIARTTLGGELLGVEATREALVLLLAPTGRIAAATLTAVSASGVARSAALDRVWIGFERPDTHAEDYVAKQRQAGFTVEPGGARAFVFPAGSDAAEVDLRTMAVSYHSLSQPASLFGRLQRLVDPVATAKSVEGPWRAARWLGGGIVAVTGSDHATWKDRESRLQSRSDPAGLLLVDTNTWGAHTLDRGASEAAFADGVLLATGGACNSETRVCTSMGLAAYGLDGGRRYRLFEDRPVFVSQVFRGLAYVSEENERTHVVDVASGRVVATRGNDVPWLLVENAVAFG